MQRHGMARESQSLERKVSKRKTRISTSGLHRRPEFSIVALLAAGNPVAREPPKPTPKEKPWAHRGHPGSVGHGDRPAQAGEMKPGDFHVHRAGIGGGSPDFA
jgi:hypothetical protein